MMRWINIALSVVLVVLVAALYHIRYSAEAEARALRQTERQIAAERDRMRTLQAEWSSLNDPRRLQLLSRRYLDLDRLRPSQVVDMRPRGTQTIPVLLTPEDAAGGADEPR